jgi:hypothetical protein
MLDALTPTATTAATAAAARAFAVRMIRAGFGDGTRFQARRGIRLQPWLRLGGIARRTCRAIVVALGPRAAAFATPFTALAFGALPVASRAFASRLSFASWLCFTAWLSFATRLSFAARLSFATRRPAIVPLRLAVAAARFAASLVTTFLRRFRLVTPFRARGARFSAAFTSRALLTAAAFAPAAVAPLVIVAVPAAASTFLALAVAGGTLLQRGSLRARGSGGRGFRGLLQPAEEAVDESRGVIVGGHGDARRRRRGGACDGRVRGGRRHRRGL